MKRRKTAPRRGLIRAAMVAALFGVLLGAAIGYHVGTPTAAPVAAPKAPAKAKAPRHPYEGATRCEMTGPRTVACDNGYRGPVV